MSRPDRSDSCGRTRHRSETRPRSGRSVFDLSVMSGRPLVLEVVGGWENTKNKKQRGEGGPALIISVPVEKIQILITNL